MEIKAGQPSDSSRISNKRLGEWRNYKTNLRSGQTWCYIILYSTLRAGQVLFNLDHYCRVEYKQTLFTRNPGDKAGDSCQICGTEFQVLSKESPVLSVYCGPAVSIVTIKNDDGQVFDQGLMIYVDKQILCGACKDRSVMLRSHICQDVVGVNYMEMQRFALMSDFEYVMVDSSHIIHSCSLWQGVREHWLEAFKEITSVGCVSRKHRGIQDLPEHWMNQNKSKTSTIVEAPRRVTRSYSKTATQQRTTTTTSSSTTTLKAPPQVLLPPKEISESNANQTGCGSLSNDTSKPKPPTVSDGAPARPKQVCRKSTGGKQYRIASQLKTGRPDKDGFWPEYYPIDKLVEGTFRSRRVWRRESELEKRRAVASLGFTDACDNTSGSESDGDRDYESSSSSDGCRGVDYDW